MPIHLPAPTVRPGGPDGQGWNRLSIVWEASAQCALQPTTPATLMESFDTRRARWGGFGSCSREGSCAECPIFQRRDEPFVIHSFDARVLVRVDPSGRPGISNRPEDGWAALHRWVTWEQLSRAQGWVWNGFHRDEHSEGFWLRRAEEEG